MTVLKLSKVELSGFKSFANETVIDVERPLTAIVGPNGSGKSNILDSVLFAFGEQSPTRLRTGRMDDLIFGGAGDVKKQHFTSVKLTFVPDFGAGRSFRERGKLVADFPLSGNGKMFGGANGDGRPKVDAPITLERRLYRDGISEYIVQGETVRLKDVDEFFGQFGLGRASVVSINQGEVERKILAKPDELRAWLVSACGIGLLMDQKRRTEEKLAETKANIVRITDLASGLERRVSELSGEKENAEKYLDLASRLSGWKRESLRRELEDCFGELRKNREVVLDIKNSLEKHASVARFRQEELEKAEAALESERNAVEAVQAALMDAEREAGAASSEHEKLMMEERMLAGQLETLGTSKDQLAASIADEEARLADLVNECDRLTLRLRTLESELAAAKHTDGEAAENLRRVREQYTRASERWSDAGRKVQDEKNSLELAKSVQARLRISEDKRKLELEMGRASLSDTLGRGREASQERETAYSLLLEAEDAEAALSESLIAARDEYKAAYAGRDVVRDELSGVQARLESLLALESEGEGFAPGKRVLLTDESLRRRLGGVRDFWHGLDFSKEISGAVYLVLRSFEDAVEVGDTAAGCEVLSEFHRDGLGMARVIANPGHEPAPTRPDWWPDGVARFYDAVRAGNGRLRRMYAETGEVAIVETIAEARSVLANEERIARAVLSDGSLILGRDEAAGGAPGGGSKALTRKRTIDELARETDRLKVEWAAVEGGVDAAADAVRRAEDRLEAASRERAERGKALAVVEEKIASIKSRTQELVLSVETYDLELLELLREREGIEREVGERGRRILAAEEELSATADRLELAKTALQSAEKERSDAERALAALGEECRVAEVGRDHADKNARDIARRVDEGRATLARIADAISAAAARISRVSGDAESAGVRSGNAQTAVSQHARDLESAKTAMETARSAYEIARVSARTADESAEHFARDSQRFEVARGRLLYRYYDLWQRWDSDNVVKPEPPPAAPGDAVNDNESAAFTGDAERVEMEIAGAETVIAAWESAGPPEPPELAGELERIGRARLKEAIADLERDIAALGAVNLLAPAQYAEESERLEFFRAQLDDLGESHAKLTELLSRLDRETLAKYARRTERIAQRFQEYFIFLFGSGAVELKFTEPEDMLSSGVEVMVMLPGERRQPLRSLSGGERSLVFLALFLAAHSMGDSGFCIMDEADAALDDANIVRLGRLIDVIAINTQFILVTHNKRTMELADALVGVVGRPKGVSRVIPVDLAKAEKLVTAGK